MRVQWGCKWYIINDVLCQIPVLFLLLIGRLLPTDEHTFQPDATKNSMYINPNTHNIYIYTVHSIYTCGLSIHCNKRPRPGFHLGSIRLSPTQLFRCSEQSPWLAGDRSQLRAYNRSLTPLRIAWLDHGHQYRGGCF